MINLVVLVGRLVKDIEVRYTENETAVGNFTIAVPRIFRNTNGKYESDFIDCTIFKEQAKIMQEYTHKGDLISVRGRLQKRSWEDKEGKKHYVIEVMTEKVAFLSTKKDGQATTKVEDNPYKDMSVKVEADQSIPISDDKLPFWR